MFSRSSLSLNTCNMPCIQGGSLQTWVFCFSFSACKLQLNHLTLLPFFPAYQQLPNPSVIHPLLKKNLFSGADPDKPEAVPMCALTQLLWHLMTAWSQSWWDLRSIGPVWHTVSPCTCLPLRPLEYPEPAPGEGTFPSSLPPLAPGSKSRSKFCCWPRASAALKVLS